MVDRVCALLLLVLGGGACVLGLRWLMVLFSPSGQNTLPEIRRGDAEAIFWVLVACAMFVMGALLTSGGFFLIRRARRTADQVDHAHDFSET